MKTTPWFYLYKITYILNSMTQKMNNMKKIFCMVLFFICFAISINAQNEDEKRLNGFMRNMLAYNQHYPQEKVYLHLDNNGYFPNEKIWFKAYVFNAGTLLPTDMSKILYVDLLTPDGTVWDRKILPIDNGRTYGMFDLSGIFTSGFFEIRAYTRAMLNWDAAYAYSRVIPIFDMPKDSINSLGLTLQPISQDLKLAIRRGMPAPLLPEGTQHEKQTVLSFYPEGGHIIKDVKNRVAYKLINILGMPIDTTVTICNPQGNVVTTSNPQHEGMGIFELPTDWTGGYAQVSDKKGHLLKFDLPAPQETGCALRVKMVQDEQMDILLTPNAHFPQGVVGLSVTCRGKLCYFDTLQLSGSQREKFIPRLKLRDGIQQVTLFTPQGEVLAERLIWINPLEPPLVMKIKQNREVYQPFSPIVVNLDLENNAGQPLRGDFSISVQDRDGMVNRNDAGLRTDMLLCSDLKGYIHHPDYYFESDDEQHQNALDLLMMVQGWRRYEWKQMAGVEPLKIKQPAESRQIIDGKIVDYAMKHPKPIPGLDVNLMIIDQAQKFRTYSYAHAVTDSLGRFAFAPKDSIFDDVLAYISATKNDVRQRGLVVLNRNFKPQPKTYEPLELELKLPEEVRTEPEVVKPLDLFEWKDTIPHIHYLPPARVKKKSKNHNKWNIPFGTRWTYMGGENLAAKFSTIYYNIEDELQDYLDKGEVVPNIFDWLQTVNKKVYYHQSTNEFTYDGKPVTVIYDNQTKPPLNFTGDMSDFRSLFITNDPESMQYLGDKSYWRTDGYIIFLYSEVGNNFINTFKKGQRNTIIHGYSRVEDFYSPNYRKTDVEDVNDRRRTLYWNPELATDEKGQAGITLYNNFRQNTHIYIDVQGIAVNGQMFDARK